MGDIAILIDIEKIYQLKQVEGIESQQCDTEQLRNYISSSMDLSEKILNDEINSSALMMFPHILGDKLFNETGYESEQVVRFIRKLNDEQLLSEDLVDLIIKEAYLVERGKKKCFQNFEKQRMDMEQMMMKQQQEFMNMQKEGKFPNSFGDM